MTEPPTAEGPRPITLVAVGIGFVVGIVVVLTLVLDMSLLQSAFIVVPIVGVAALALVGLVWAQRRGDLG